MSDSMRGVFTNLTEIRRRVFREVARIAYSDGDPVRAFEELPYQIIQGDVATYRESVFLERAIISQRVRFALGLSYQDVDHPTSIAEGLAEAAKPETYYEPPLINIIKFACNACEDNVYEVTNACQGCLAHPCREICPKQAISFRDKKAYIDQDLCILCGRCAQACPYDAIQHHVRPCAKACGVDAIGSDENGRADIDYSKCVSCGQCLVNCPFGAISDKSQLYQVIQAIKEGKEVIACVAPAFVGQFGGKGNVGKLREAFAQLGFADVEEVALGADLCTMEEADDFFEEVPEHLPFMGTSCCPAWSSMAKRQFPEHAHCISMALTPMTLTARMVRLTNPDAKIVFVGPCSAKKLEAMRKSVRSEVDFVLTFEEMAGMMEAKEIEYLQLEDDEESDFGFASYYGRSFAIAGGVADAVASIVKRKHPEVEVNIASAQGLRECREMMQKAVKGAYDGYLLEGMACPGGCVAGPGTLQPIKKSSAAVRAYAKRSPHSEIEDRVYAELASYLDFKGSDKQVDAVAELEEAMHIG